MFDQYCFDPENPETIRNTAGNGEYMLFCLPGAHPQKDALCAAQAVFESEPDVGMVEFREQPEDPFWMFHPVTLEVWIPQSLCFAVRRSSCEQAGGFQPQLGYCAHMDLAFHMQKAGCRVLYTPQAEYRTDKNITLAEVLRRWELLYFTAADRPVREVRKQALLLFGANADLKKTVQLAKYVRRECLQEKIFILSIARLLRGEERRLPGKIPGTETGNVFFSVLIRTYRRPETLARTLAGLVHQTYRNFEVIVAEDGDEPCAERLCSEMKDRLHIRYECAGKHIRRSAAGNAAMKKAKGEYFVFLDEDDYFLPNHLEILARTLHEHPECRMAVCSSAELWGMNRPDGKFAVHRIVQRTESNFSPESLCISNRLPIQAAAFHRSLPEEYGGLDEGLDALEDWDLWLRYAMHTKTAFTNRITSMFRIPDGPGKWEIREREMSNARAHLLEKWKNIPVISTAADIMCAAGVSQQQDNDLQALLRLKNEQNLADEFCDSRRWRTTAFLRIPAQKIAQAAEWIAIHLRSWSDSIGPQKPDPEKADEKAYTEFLADARNSWCWRITEPPDKNKQSEI